MRMGSNKCQWLIFTTATNGMTESKTSMCSPFLNLSFDVSTTHVDTIFRAKLTFAKSKDGKDQEMIKYNTRSDPGHRMGK